MKFILTLLLTIAYVLAVQSQRAATETRQCIQAAARVDFADGTPVGFKARGRIRECPTSEFGCGIVRKFGISRELEEDDPTTVDPNSVNKAYKTVNMGCVAPKACEKIVGSTEGSACVYTDYVWNRFVPQSCNATRDFDPRRFRQNVRLVMACCNSDDCYTQTQANSDSITRTTVENTCTEKPALGEYITGLHACWNTGRASFREFFTCDSEGLELVDFREVCREDVYGDYDRSLAEDSRGTAGENCRWRPTCSEELQRLIESFGECACDVAKDKGFTGEAIGALMESYWNEFCPQIEISCAAENGGLFLRRRRRRRRIKFKIAKAKSYIEGRIAAWRTKMADYLRIRAEDAEGVIEITVDESDDTSRRLLEDTTVVNIDVFTDDVMNDAINDDACNESGLQTTLEETALEKMSCEYSDVEDALVGSDASATTTETPTTTTDEKGSAASMVAFGVVIGVLGYMFE